MRTNHYKTIAKSLPDHRQTIANHRQIIARSSPDHRQTIASSSPDHCQIIANHRQVPWSFYTLWRWSGDHRRWCHLTSMVDHGLALLFHRQNNATGVVLAMV